LPWPPDESQLCRSVIKKCRFRRGTTDSGRGRRDAALYVYSVFKRYEIDKRRERRSTSVTGRFHGQQARRAEKGAAVCRFAIDLTTKRASLTFPQSSPMQAPLSSPPTRQSIGPPGGYKDQRPNGCPHTRASGPRPAPRRPPAVLVQKGATDNPAHRFGQPHPPAPPPVRQSPPTATTPHELNRCVTAPPAPAAGASPHPATIASDQGRRDMARSSERTG